MLEHLIPFNTYFKVLSLESLYSMCRLSYVLTKSGGWGYSFLTVIKYKIYIRPNEREYYHSVSLGSDLSVMKIIRLTTVLFITREPNSPTTVLSHHYFSFLSHSFKLQVLVYCRLYELLLFLNLSNKFITLAMFLHIFSLFQCIN